MTTQKTVKRIIISKQMYYDLYECDLGDGFYPQLSFVERYAHALIYFQFIQERNVWKQIGDLPITGLDPPYGEELLTALNSENGVDASQIENTWDKIIYNNKNKTEDNDKI